MIETDVGVCSAAENLEQNLLAHTSILRVRPSLTAALGKIVSASVPRESRRYSAGRMAERITNLPGRFCRSRFVGSTAMSMNAMFVQVEDAEIDRFERNPELVEALFADEALPTSGLLNLTAAMQGRVLNMRPEAMAAKLSHFPEQLRQQIEGSMRRTQAALAAGRGGEIQKLLEEQLARHAEGSTAKRERLSLDKVWHGVHYLLAGAAEPGPKLRSQAVMGGVELGDDPEGFSGYGPARYFRVAQVRELSEELRRPEVEVEAAARFDAARMSRLQIYPGWSGEQDREWVMDGFRRLRDFYSSAAERGRGAVTCLV